MHGALYSEDRSSQSRKWSWKLLSPLYAEIVLDVEARDLKDRLFTYRVPEFLADEVFVGAQVLVPFGHQETVGGYVVSLLNDNKTEFRLKDISEVVEPDPLFDKDYVDFLGWLAFKSCSRLSDVIQAAIPASLAPRIKRVIQVSKKLGIEELDRIINQLKLIDPARATIVSILMETKTHALSLKVLRQRFKQRTRSNYSFFQRALTFLKQEGVVEIVAESADKITPKTISTVLRAHEEPRTPRQREIVALLEHHDGMMPLSELLKTARTTYGTIHKLVKDGVVQLDEQEVVRDPMKSYTLATHEGSKKPQLTQHQEEVMSILLADLRRILDENDCQISVDRQPVTPWLLHGVTGSGKTEIYLQLIEEVLLHKQTALLLVPEISLTPQLASRLKERFGDRVSVWHSAISPGERYDTWRRLRSGDVSVLLGARSAILANIPDLGLIILDEEHDGSYKQTSPSPRYNAKEVALEKARRSGAMVLFGSATPDMVTYHRAKEMGRIVELPERVHKQAMPDVTVVDMRDELSLGNRSILSQPLQVAIGERLQAGEQIILLMNRRGYASHVFCRACGYVAKCKNCSVALVYHRISPSRRTQSAAQLGSKPAAPSLRDGFLTCHHCNYERRMLSKCNNCQSQFIKEYGLGTQQVEETVGQMFPDARILRLDSDVTARKGAYRDIYERFSRGDADVLIGTQMVAKGLDIANVTLVGVLVADAALNMPDYRSTERGFQLLSQVSGRAGRGLKPGEVILQTYNPDLDVLHWAKKHDFASFFQAELAAREAFSYPPFSRVIRIVIQGVDAPEVELECEHLAEEISLYMEDKIPSNGDSIANYLQILGPAPCIIEKVKNKFRFHLLIKVKGGDDLIDSLLLLLRNKKTPKQLSLAVDVDALDLL